jgi:catechol 2,3-dioxygenase-like lactoylglutathione lyase family enzyme
MAIQMKTSGVHHVSLRVSDLKRAKKFYCDTLGFKHLMDSDNLTLFLAGGTAFGLRGPTAEMPKGDKFSPFRVGVDHIALACTDASELNRVADALAAAGIENTGAKHDETLDKDYVAFKDPDRIAWEFYMA